MGGLIHDPATTGMLEACVAITLQDGTTAYVPAQILVTAAGGATATTLPDGNGVVQVDTLMSKLADSFGDQNYGTGGGAKTGAAALTALAAGNWTVARSTLAAMTVTINNGSLVVNMGTTNGDELFLLGKAGATIPATLIATFLMSQRIVNNEVRFGYAEVDAAGNLVPNPWAAGFPRNMAAVMLNSAAANNAFICTMAEGIAAEKQVAISSQITTAALVDYIVECRAEDVMVASSLPDNVTARQIAGRTSSVIPDPGKRYAPMIWIRNNGVPASGTTVTINRIYSADIQELQAEVTSRGSQAAAQGLGVTVLNTLSVLNSGAVLSTTMNAATNSNLPHKLISAASTNATSVKASAGRIYGGAVFNNSAAVKYIHFYNKASAPTVGTDVPILTYPIPVGALVGVSTMFAEMYGYYFSTGIAYSLTGAYADNDATAVAANDLIVNFNYV